MWVKGAQAMGKTFNILIYKDGETGTYWGTCPALEGCNTQGDTVEEVKENMAEAISLCLEGGAGGQVIEATVTLGALNA
jgi:predicted RNase H-like HicB family nuclease